MRSSMTAIVLMGFMLISMINPSLSAGNYTLPKKVIGPYFKNATMMQYINETVYNGKLAPLNYSWPILKIVGSCSLTGAYNERAPMYYNVIYPFYVDMINLKGGIRMHGKQYLVQMTIADDQSSTILTQYLYSEWLSDPSITVFLSPLSDALHVLLNPMMVRSGRIWVNLLNGDPSTFINYPYLLTPANTKDTIPITSLDAINTRVQTYHRSVSSLTHYDTIAKSSPYGIKTVCLLEHTDTFGLVISLGVRSWIRTENARRAGLGAGPDDMIQVMNNASFLLTPTLPSDWPTYMKFLDKCPDDVDALIVSEFGAQDNCMALALGLAHSKLRPRAAWSSCALTGWNASNPDMVSYWTGWLGHGNTKPATATLPMSTFANTAEMTKAYTTYFNSAPGWLHKLYVQNFDVMNAAFNQSLSLAPADVRDGWLGLGAGNYLTWVGREVLIDPLTGVNILAKVVPVQAHAVNGPELILDANKIIYPYPWPWHRVLIGDHVDVHQDQIGALVGVVLCVLGAWVAAIVIEQAVWSRRRRSNSYLLWLAVVAAALGGAGMFCAMLMAASGLTTKIPTEEGTQDLYFSLPIGFLALLPSLLMTFAGLFVMMGDVQLKDAAAKHTEAYVQRQIQRENEEEKRKRAALDHRAHITHLCQSISWRVVVGGALIALAVILTRATLLYIFVHDADWTPSTTAWVVSIIAHLVLTMPAMLQFFHGVRWRAASVFMLAAAVMIDWHVHVQSMDWALANKLTQPAALYDVLNVSEMVIQLLSGIIAMLLCFVFIGLQFSRMQLSRNGLALLVASLENTIAKQKSTCTTQQHTIASQQMQADQLVRIIDCINLMTPVSQQYAYCLAVNASASTAAHFYDFHLVSDVVVSVPQPVLVDDGSVVKDSADSPQGARRAFLMNPTSSGAGTTFSSTAASSSSRAIVQLTRVVSNPSAVVPVDENGDVETRVLSVRGGTSFSNKNTVTGRLSEDDGCNGRGRNDTSIHQRKSDVMPFKQTAQMSIVNNNKTEYSVSGSHGSLTGVSAATQNVDHAARIKQFESDALQMLQSQGAPGKTLFPVNHSFAADLTSRDVDISVTRSVADMQRTNGFPHPSLSQLLQHPVCLEIVKAELERIKSVENAMFYVHAQRYRKISNDQLRTQLARHICATYISPNAEQQININTRQRDVILQTVNRKNTTPINLFNEAITEVLLLMETNMMKSFVSSPSFRACQWIFCAVDIKLAYVGVHHSADFEQHMHDRPSQFDPTSFNKSMITTVNQSSTPVQMM